MHACEPRGRKFNPLDWEDKSGWENRLGASLIATAEAPLSKALNPWSSRMCVSVIWGLMANTGGYSEKNQKTIPL